MTENTGSPSEAPKGLKVTLVQGVIGAISLAGTTAIPLLVNRYLAPPTPAESPAPAAQVSPAPATTTSPLVATPDQTMQMGTLAPQDMQIEEGGKGKKGRKNKD